MQQVNITIAQGESHMVCNNNKSPPPRTLAQQQQESSSSVIMSGDSTTSTIMSIDDEDATTTTTVNTVTTWYCDHCQTRNGILVTDCRWCGMDKLKLQQQKCNSSLTSAFAALLHDTAAADVTFQVDDDCKKFAAHKVVLAARSTYFRSMFYGGLQESNNNMNDNKNSVIVLHNVTAIAFDQVLRYLYTGNPSSGDNNNDSMTVDATLNLLVTADLFQLAELQLLCEYRLAAQLTVTNVLLVLHTSLTVVVAAHHLRASALAFVRHHGLEAVAVDAFLKSFHDDTAGNDSSSSSSLPVYIQTALLQAKKPHATPCTTPLLFGSSSSSSSSTDETYAALPWAP